MKTLGLASVAAVLAALPFARLEFAPETGSTVTKTFRDSVVTTIDDMSMVVDRNDMSSMVGEMGVETVNEGEIVVTRDSKPVARILPYEAPKRARRARFDPAAQGRWLARFWRGRDPGPSTDEWLRRDQEA